MIFEKYDQLVDPAVTEYVFCLSRKIFQKQNLQNVKGS